MLEKSALARPHVWVWGRSTAFSGIIESLLTHTCCVDTLKQLSVPKGPQVSEAKHPGRQTDVLGFLFLLAYSSFVCSLCFFFLW